MDDFAVTFKVWLAGSVVAALVSLFAWPCFRRHPVSWLPAGSVVGVPLPEEAEEACCGRASSRKEKGEKAPAAPGRSTKKHR